MKLERIPWITKFCEAETHQQRAEVLLTMPVQTLSRYHEVLERNCMVTGFTAGTVYIECLRTCYCSERYRGEYAKGSSNLAKAHNVLLQFLEGKL